MASATSPRRPRPSSLKILSPRHTHKQRKEPSFGLECGHGPLESAKCLARTCRNRDLGHGLVAPETESGLPQEPTRRRKSLWPSRRHLFLALRQRGTPRPGV
jgi:hypothetical protein